MVVWWCRSWSPTGFPPKKKHGPFRGWWLAVQMWDQVDHMSSLIKRERHEKKKDSTKTRTRSILYEHCIPNSWLLFCFFWTWYGILPSFSPRVDEELEVERSVVSYGAALSAAEKVASIGRVWHGFRRIIPVVGCSQETLRIPIWEDWGTWGKIRGITIPHRSAWRIFPPWSSAVWIGNNPILRGFIYIYILLNVGESFIPWSIWVYIYILRTNIDICIYIYIYLFVHIWIYYAVICTQSFNIVFGLLWSIDSDIPWSQISDCAGFWTFTWFQNGKFLLRLNRLPRWKFNIGPEQLPSQEERITFLRDHVKFRG